MPAGPVIGLSAMPTTRQPGCAPSQAAIRSQTARWTAGSRTTPPLPTCSGPASNCGLISATSAACPAASAKGAGSTVARPIKLASQVIESIGSGICGARQIAGVDALMDDDARVLAQFPGELAAPDIDRVDPRGAARQQHIGKAAGRGADIERDSAGRIDREMVERVRELEAAARHPGMVAAGDGQARHPRQGACPACRCAARRRDDARRGSAPAPWRGFRQGPARRAADRPGASQPCHPNL